VLDGARIFHMNVNCSNLARSRDFYVDGCGLVEGVRTTPEDTQPGTAFGLDRARWDAFILVGDNGFDGGAIDLLEWLEPAPTGAPPGALFESGLQRIGVMVTDLDATLTRVPGLGGTSWGEPVVHHLADGGQVRLALISDPDGITVELVEGSVNRLAFVAVACSDLERSVDFYLRMGFRELARIPSRSSSGAHLRIDGPVSMDEVLLEAPGAGEVHLMLAGFERPEVRATAVRPANALGLWRVALVLPELDRAVAAMRDLGAELLSDPQSMSMGPGLPELQFVCFRGPDDEVIELIEQPVVD
jgi:glyoxylase I family protein